VKIDIPKSWKSVIGGEFTKPYFQKLDEFVTKERKSFKIFPPEDDVFSAFQLTPFDEVNVLLLGQDPYIHEGEAHGLCFSVRPGITVPPSLRNMYKELASDVGFRKPNNGFLEPWAKQGMLMLNTVLTVREGQAFSHKGQGWEIFTDAVISKVNEKTSPVIFVLFGKAAQEKIPMINLDLHKIVKRAHPSPMAAKFFLGSKPFSEINKKLEESGKPPIDWQIPDLP
jgi:uracil-DNA glycosylase